MADAICEGNLTNAKKIILPYLNDRNPFRLLDLIGNALADCPRAYLYQFLEIIAEDGTEGGWVIIASALHSLPGEELAKILEECKNFIIQADVWFACDIFGERICGPALLYEFDRTLTLLSPWREHSNPWVRRDLGVAVHFWAKRTRGGEMHCENAIELLDFIGPLFEERDLRAAKGVGWGLKTIGRYYPQEMNEWFMDALVIRKRKPRAVVKKKALTYLPESMKRKFFGGN